jgi:ketosteroid isomerase-like protein
MAEDDLLALRQLYEEFANGNFGKGSELFAPDVVFEPSPERSAIHGLESIIAYMRDFLAQWSDYRVEAQEFIEAGDSIVVTERQYATGEWSAIETVKSFYAVWTFRDGLVAHVRWDDDRDTALAAAGLAE